jgi:uncharacterized membrane protein YdbT with pleckstrin-like domain
MSYIQKTLLPDERIMYWSQLHWVIYLKGLTITIFGGLVGFNSEWLLATLVGPQMAHSYFKGLAACALGIVVIGVFFLLRAYVRQTTTELAVTNRRIIAKYGFISRTTFEIMISRITGANFDQTVVGRIMGFGTILVHGAGGEVSPIDLVADPERFHTALMGVMEQAQNAGRRV